MYPLIFKAVSLCEGDEFRSELDNLLRQGLTRAVPSLYSDVCSLVRSENHSGQITICTDPLEFRDHPVVRLATDLVDG